MTEELVQVSAWVDYVQTLDREKRARGVGEQTSSRPRPSR